MQAEYLPDALSADQCDTLLALVQAHQLRDAGLVGGATAHQIRRAEMPRFRGINIQPQVS